jgi:cyclophilin family peptidyl-prolyl cis-trans isomerase
MSLTGCSKSDGSDGAQASADEPAVAKTSECPPEDGAKEAVTSFPEDPPMCIDEDKRYSAETTTTKGTVTIDLDTAKTPVTANNFIFLARWGYYDDTSLFRTEADSGIIQGGAPHTQDASDPGPGYSIDDEGTPFPASAYAPGTLAMANRGPDTAGAQFFFLATEQGRYLGDPAMAGPSAGGYAVFGKTTKGLDVLQAIAQLDDGTGAPTEDVRIETVEIIES